MVHGLTPKQADLLEFIRRYMSEHNGVAPSYDDMGKHLGVYSRGGNLKRYVDELEKRGLLTRDHSRRRSIALADPKNQIGTQEPGTSANMERYRAVEDSLRRHYVLVSGEDPGLPFESALRWLAVALVAMPDDRSVAWHLKRFSGALANAAHEIEGRSGVPF